MSDLVQMRTSTDIEIPISRLLLPLTNYLVWAAFVIAWWSGGASDLTVFTSSLGLAGLATSAVTSWLIFTLLNRANEHSVRTRALLGSALGQLAKLIGTSRQETMLSLNTAEQDFYDLDRSERVTSAILWALLAAIPLVGWIFLILAQWRLSRDLARHSRLEGLVVDDVDRTLRTVGPQALSARPPSTSSNDILGFIVVFVSFVELFSVFFLGLSGALVLIFLTIGALSLLWIQLSIMGPTSHFHFHSAVEADLIRALPDPNNTGKGTT